MASSVSSKIFFCRLCEFVLGIICFSLFKHFGYLPCTAQQLASLTWDCRIRAEIGTVAYDSFPLFILPILFAGHSKHGNKFDYNIINPLFAFVGFLLYLIAGSIQFSAINEYSAIPGFNAAPLYALSAMSIIASILFLGEMIYWLMRKRQIQE